MVKFDAVSSKNSADFYTAEVTWSHIVGDRAKILLVGFIHTQGDTSPASIDYVRANGEALTKISRIVSTSGGDNIAAELWYILKPSTGTITIATKATGAAWGCAVAATYEGVDEIHPFDTYQENECAACQSVGNSVSGFDNSVAVSVGGKHYDGGTMGVGSGETERAEAYCSGQATNDRESRCNWSEEETAGGSVTLTHTHSEGLDRPMAAIAIALKPEPPDVQRPYEYTYNIESGKGLIDSKGQLMDPVDIEVDKWVRILGLEPPLRGDYETMVEHPNYCYIVSKTYDEDAGIVRIRTDRNQFADALISRILRGG